jgi:hypothetical protein
VWQQAFAKHQSKEFTVVGLALDTEGIPPAKLYYDKFKVTFPALVDPNYATRFTTVPHTFFIDEHGVVRKKLRGPGDLPALLASLGKPRAVTEEVRARFSLPGKRLGEAQLTALRKQHQANPADLRLAVQLGSRLVDAKHLEEARALLQKALQGSDARKVALSGESEKSTLLAQAYFQLSRACAGDREAQVKYATLSFYLYPSIGYGKQIARIIAPEKFDNRPGGDFDNRFREGTLTRLRKEREAWLKQKE